MNILEIYEKYQKNKSILSSKALEIVRYCLRSDIEYCSKVDLEAYGYPNGIVEAGPQFPEYIAVKLNLNPLKLPKGASNAYATVKVPLKLLGNPDWKGYTDQIIWYCDKEILSV